MTLLFPVPSSLALLSLALAPQVSLKRSPPDPSPARNWLLSFLLRDCRHPVPACVSARWWPVAEEFQGSQGCWRRVAVIWDRGPFGGGDMSFFFSLLCFSRQSRSQDDVQLAGRLQPSILLSASVAAVGDRVSSPERSGLHRLHVFLGREQNVRAEPPSIR